MLLLFELGKSLMFGNLGYAMQTLPESYRHFNIMEMFSHL